MPATRTVVTSRLSIAAVCVLGCGLSAMAQTQGPEPMGTVSARDARVSGGLDVQGSVTRLLTNASVTAAPDHAAPVTLQRGGGVLVCSTSEFHLLRSGSGGSLIFGLDRGAIQVVTQSRPQDVVLTPDLKLVPVTKGLLDLSLRVTREGDTCVDNAGAEAPVLNVTDPFSSANYRVLPGQHLMFIKGDLHKVVDHERSSCGCPVIAPKEAAVPGKPVSPAQAAAATHPFPQAESEGLAPAPEATNEAPAGTASSQVTTTFSYGEGQGPPPSIAAAEPASGATGPEAPAQAAEPASDAPAEGGIIHAIGRFFHRLFHPAK